MTWPANSCTFSSKKETQAQSHSVCKVEGTVKQPAADEAGKHLKLSDGNDFLVLLMTAACGAHDSSQRWT